MKKVIFLGSKEVGFAALHHLIEFSKPLGIEIIGLLSNDRKISENSDSLIDLANQNSIPVISKLDDLLSIPHIDYLISVQYHEILEQKQIDCAKELAINLHMAPLPEYRGCNQFSFAIIDDAKEFGTTMHVMESGIDSGDLLFESRFPVDPKETVKSLHAKTTAASITLFKNSIENILRGNYFRIEQSSLYQLRNQNFHLRSEMNDIKQIDVSWPDEKIDRYIRATYFPPFPAPFTVINGQKIDLSLDWRNEIPS
jgi:methionyl-tRNA formyltransferase